MSLPAAAPSQSSPQEASARPLNGKPVTAIALDYGGYAVTLVMPQLSLRVPGRTRWLRDRRAEQTIVCFLRPAS